MKFSEKYGTKPFTQAGFIGLLEYLLNQVRVKKIFSGRQSPQYPKSKFVEIYPGYIFDLPVTGRKKVSFHHHGADHTETLVPGEILFSEPGAWKLPVWEEYHELSCLVYNQDYIRITYVDFTEPAPRGQRPVCSNFFHTRIPPTDNMLKILRLLCSLNRDGDPENASAPLAESLFRMTLAAVRANPVPAQGKARSTYWKVRHYLEENFTAPCPREETARRFNINPSYLSRLFMEQGNRTYLEFLRELRMEHAAWLLLNTDLTVNETADRCGYESLTSFTALFKSFHKMPPAAYRRVNGQNP